VRSAESYANRNLDKAKLLDRVDEFVGALCV
jgi:hypothetical protein